jgi:cyclopropane-fatty-acyl-phospholipid synthase
MRVLDVGCGWGAFVVHVARTYGVSAVGVTLSREQAAFARARVEAEGLDGRVEIRVQDYREVADGPFDAVASIGMAEHVGREQLPEYARHLESLLAVRGRLLNHAISRRPGPPGDPKGDRTSFIERYVFPDGELEPLSTMVEAIEGAGLEVRDVESLREHYALTLREWVWNLEHEWDRAVALSSAGRSRVWRLYMAGSALAFRANRIGVNQILAVKPAPDGESGMPRTRDQQLQRPAAAAESRGRLGKRPLAGAAGGSALLAVRQDLGPVARFGLRLLVGSLLLEGLARLLGQMLSRRLVGHGCSPCREPGWLRSHDSTPPPGAVAPAGTRVLPE